MIYRLISHRAIDHRLIKGGKQSLAGRRLPFFRPIILAILSLTILLPIAGFPQSPNSTAIADEEALLSSIQRLNQNQKSELHQLLNDNRRLFTLRLWQKLMILIGDHANEQTFKSIAPGYSIIHCATHGMFDNRHPHYSFLLLAKAKDATNDDGLLEAREILNLKLSADLVVLSACETAKGRIGAGEGVMGLSWAFFAAGCRSTLVSQWKVNSASTADWMERFYQRLRATASNGKENKAMALRLAVLSMMKDNRYRHPFYWASFILIGASE